MKRIPEIGEKLNCFDDGKVKKYRKYTTVINDVVTFEDLKKSRPDIIENWVEEKESCDWLYASKTDYFIFTTRMTNEDEFDEEIFVRTVDGGWFGLGFWSGRLDIDGKLTKQI